MDFVANHHPAIYALIATLVLPLAVFGLWRFLTRRQQRLAREAMQRGNVLHRNWLEQSKDVEKQG